MSPRMHRVAVHSSCAAILVLAAYQGAQAAEETRPHPIFDAGNGDASAMACFTRLYDAEHLAQHPEQNVDAMTVLIYRSDPAREDRPYAIRAGVKFKTASERFDSYGECSSAGGEGANFDCALECDAGHIGIRQKDATSIYVDVPAGAHLSECGEDNVQLGEDDRIFRLERVKPGACSTLVHDLPDLQERLSKAK